MSALPANLLHFGQVLRALGLDIPAAAMLDVALALEHIDIGRRADFHFTLRSLLVHRHQDLQAFDAAFMMFWRRPRGEWSVRDLKAMGEQRRVGPPERETPREAGTRDGATGSRVETMTRVAPLSDGQGETLRRKDFAQFTEEEVRDARAMLAGLRWEPDPRRTRRWVAGAGSNLDLRRLIRRSVRYGGEPVRLPTRVRRWKRRPLVLICDVSGSMERYSRMLLHFVHGLATRGGRPGSGGSVNAFLFATQLTRVTRDIERRGADQAVARMLKRLPDWGGGTRIGDALRTFNVKWARRLVGRGPIVLLISDGWDRGEPDHLAREMARLARRAHRLIWLNPLLGSPDYQPITRGMQAALPFVDDFLPVHNLVSLESLAVHLNGLRPSRAGRRKNGPSSSAIRTRAAAGRRAPSGRRLGPDR